MTNNQINWFLITYTSLLISIKIIYDYSRKSCMIDSKKKISMIDSNKKRFYKIHSNYITIKMCFFCNLLLCFNIKYKNTMIFFIKTIFQLLIYLVINFSNKKNQIKFYYISNVFTFKLLMILIIIIIKKIKYDSINISTEIYSFFCLLFCLNMKCRNTTIFLLKTIYLLFTYSIINFSYKKKW